MSDDIVTRLRHIEIISNGYGEITLRFVKPEVAFQAANEIERLRAYVLSFPCTCWINQPKCVRCEVAEAAHES